MTFEPLTPRVLNILHMQGMHAKFNELLIRKIANYYERHDSNCEVDGSGSSSSSVGFSSRRSLEDRQTWQHIGGRYDNIRIFEVSRNARPFLCTSSKQNGDSTAKIAKDEVSGTSQYEFLVSRRHIPCRSSCSDCNSLPGST